MNKNQNIKAEIINNFRKIDANKINITFKNELNIFNKKIVVLDDDPTGVQTVHGVSVYTDCDKESILSGFKEPSSMFFILTNSRGMIPHEAKVLNVKIAERVAWASKCTNKDFVLISRSDSTLRGHYPLETETLKRIVENETDKDIHGEVIMPFFIEGGRYTLNDIHYVKNGEVLVPAGNTEFATDKTFGYKSSHLGEWCEEKTNAKYKSNQIVYISLDEIRSFDIDGIVSKLLCVENFNKIIVNAIDYSDVKVFCIAYLKALKHGKNFIFRSAASFTKVLGGISDKPLLTKDDIVENNNKNGGVVIIGSYVNKTTLQLNELKKSKCNLNFIEFNTKSALLQGGLEAEVTSIVEIINKTILSGKSAVVYTTRELLVIPDATKEEQLQVQTRISDALTSIVGKLEIKPSFILAKGGITSSDVGTKALKVKKATVIGQIKPGVPVWMTDYESKFANIPYVIFPGNVGDNDTLKQTVEVLTK